jgi:hypothetical protein
MPPPDDYRPTTPVQAIEFECAVLTFGRTAHQALEASGADSAELARLRRAGAGCLSRIHAIVTDLSTDEYNELIALGEQSDLPVVEILEMALHQELASGREAKRTRKKR